MVLGAKFSKGNKAARIWRARSIEGFIQTLELKQVGLQQIINDIDGNQENYTILMPHNEYRLLNLMMNGDK